MAEEISGRGRRKSGWRFSFHKYFTFFYYYYFFLSFFSTLFLLPTTFTHTPRPTTFSYATIPKGIVGGFKLIVPNEVREAMPRVQVEFQRPSIPVVHSSHNFYTSCLSRKSRWRECWRVGWRVVTGHGRKYFVYLEAFRFLLLSLRGKDFGLLSVLIPTGFWAQIDRYTSKDLF